MDLDTIYKEPFNMVDVVTEYGVRNLNPWWKDPEKINDNQKITEWRASAIRHMPGLKNEIRWDFLPDNTVVYTMRGPRQVGKTTLLMLQIKYFLESGVSPWRVFYYSLDIDDTKQDIVDAVEIYSRISPRLPEGDRRYILLDEATSVTDWQKSIKWMVDNNKIPNVTLMATGSQAIGLKSAPERLPNRRGMVDGSYDKILLPMKFSEFACLQSEDLKSLHSDLQLRRPENKKGALMDLASCRIGENVEKINAYQNELNDSLYEYMVTGGTPYVINTKITAGVLDENVYSEYLNGITGEWSRQSKKETLLRQFGGAVINCLSSHTSWSGLSRESAMGSPNTAADYAYTLDDLFVLSIVHMYGTTKRIPRVKNDRKLYFRDPFLFHIFNGWMSQVESFDLSMQYLQHEYNQGKIVEGIVADHLIRLAFTLSKKKRTFRYHDHIFYWKNSGGKEVDFVLSVGDTEVPIEVKFRNNINEKRDLSGLVSFQKETKRKGIVLSKFGMRSATDYAMVPASVFLFLM